MIPLGKRVLIRDLDTEETLPGGKIVLLDDTRINLTEQQAEVVAAGASCDERLKPGTWILHKPFARIAGPDATTFWINEEDCVAVIE